MDQTVEPFADFKLTGSVRGLSCPNVKSHLSCCSVDVITSRALFISGVGRDDTAMASLTSYVLCAGGFFLNITAVTAELSSILTG